MGDEEDFGPEPPPPPATPVRGELLPDGVLVPDTAEASTLRNKGAYGETLSGGRLRLSYLEAAHLLEAGRLTLERRGSPVSFRELVRLAHRGNADFEVTYVVYRDLRGRGYVVEEGTPPIDFRVHPRGGRPGKSQTRTWVSAMSERAPFSLADLLERVRHVQGLRRHLLLGVVDEESDLTYYSARDIAPAGTVAVGRARASADLLADRALVADETEARSLASAGHFGKFLGRRLQLSLLETAFLMDRGLEVRSARSERPVARDELLRRARRLQAEFDLRLRVYADLRGRGVLVKTGYKYGTHFRAYEGDPEKVHAKYLVHALPEDYRGGWPEVSRAIRLAHGVKKQLLLAATGTGVTYVHLARVRP
jgi:tRNA-intron endonuclease